jgi:hypothetical protein
MQEIKDKTKSQNYKPTELEDSYPTNSVFFHPTSPLPFISDISSGCVLPKAARPNAKPF